MNCKEVVVFVLFFIVFFGGIMTTITLNENAKQHTARVCIQAGGTWHNGDCTLDKTR